jgi:lipopolysaccharide biosynthesis glycosyltransferase
MTSPQHDCAIAFCIDRKYLHLALFVIWQINHLNPNRHFDIVIASQDDLELPDWAKSCRIVMHKTGELPEAAEAARFLGSMSSLFRIMLARELGDRYRRIIYMDGDMFVEGGDFNRLLDIDLGPHPLAAALDVYFYYRAGQRAEEFVRTGLPTMPYFNSGFMVIDTKAFREQEVERRAMEVCTTFPHAIILGDQSLLNLALLGKFAELQPCWNWQLSKVLPMMSHTYPVFVHHFIGMEKPDRASNQGWPVRFNEAYRTFMTGYLPDALPGLGPLRASGPMPFSEMASNVIWHVMATQTFEGVMARHTDPYRAVL